MVATEVVKRSKQRYWNRDTKRIAWAYEEDLPDYAREGYGADTSRFDKLIENLENDLERAQADMLAARDPRLRDLAQMRYNQIQLAIENAHEAALVTDSVVQFGTSDHRTFAVRIPPHLDDFVNIFPKKTATHFRYVATDPLEIAWLRRQVRDQGIPGLREMPVGLYYALSKDGNGRGMWVPADQYHEGVKNEIFQP